MMMLRSLTNGLSLAITLTLNLISINGVNGFITSCPGGYKACPANTSPFTMSTAMNISNCIFDGCPQLVISALSSTVFITNVTFKNSVSTGASANGGCVNAGSASLSIFNSKFMNCTSSGNGGAIYFSASVTTISLTAVNTIFQGNMATGDGGAVKLAGSGGGFFTNCDFIDNKAYEGGGIMSGDSGIYRIIGGTCVRNSATLLGGCFYMGGVETTLMSVTGINSTASDGGLLVLNYDVPTVVISNITSINCYGVIYVYGDGYYPFSITSSTFLNSIGYSYSNPSWVTLVMRDVTIRNGNGGAVFGGVVTLDRVTIQGLTSGGAIVSVDMCAILNSVIDGNSNWSDDPIQARFLNVTNSTFTNNFGMRSGLFYINPGGSVYVANSLIANNYGSTGGAFHVAASPNSFTISSNTIIRGNTAELQGGAFYWDARTNLQIIGSNIVIQGNKALYLTSSSLAYFNSNAFFSGNGRSNVIEGSAFILLSTTAYNITMSDTLKNFLPPTAQYTGPACYLQLENTDDFNMGSNSVSLYLSQGLPTISIVARDYFDNIAEVDTDNLVVVQVKEIAQSAFIKGETVKAIISANRSDFSTFKVQFRNLQFRNVNPGNYLLSVQSSSLNQMIGKPNATLISVTYKSCDALTQRFMPAVNQCFNLASMNGTGVSALAGVAGVGVLITLVLAIYVIWQRRSYAISHGSGSFYMLIVLLGSAISLISIIPNVVRTSASVCSLTAWIDNIGFALVFGGIFARVSELQRSFFRDEDSEKKNSFSMFRRVATIASAVILMVALLVAWTATGASTFQDVVLNASAQIVTDSCSIGTFGSAVSVIRLMVAIAVASLSYSAIEVQQAFPEIRAILVFSYNWVIFGCFLSIIGKLVVQDPGSSFVLSAVALIIPNVLGTTGLVLFKSSNRSVADSGKSKAKPSEVTRGSSISKH